MEASRSHALSGAAVQPLTLHEDRYFDPDPTHRRIARELYAETRTLPIVGPHGHVDPALLAENRPFPEPTALILIPDHYIFRMLYSQGISLESLGIPTRDGTAVESDPRKIWQIFEQAVRDGEHVARVDVDGRSMHRGEHRVGNVRRAGNAEELATPGDCHPLGLRAHRHRGLQLALCHAAGSAHQ